MRIFTKKYETTNWSTFVSFVTKKWIVILYCLTINHVYFCLKIRNHFFKYILLCRFITKRATITKQIATDQSNDHAICEIMRSFWNSRFSETISSRSQQCCNHLPNQRVGDVAQIQDLFKCKQLEFHLVGMRSHRFANWFGCCERNQTQIIIIWRHRGAPSQNIDDVYYCNTVCTICLGVLCISCFIFCSVNPLALQVNHI